MNFVNPYDAGFTFLHILAIFNPSYITKALPLVNKDIWTIRDKSDRLFYEYIDNDIHKSELNLFDSSLFNILVFPKEKTVCRICYNGNITHVLIPCGHIFCNKCSLKIWNSENNKCPICRKRVDNVNQIFLN
jgi:hypothetical protein